MKLYHQNVFSKSLILFFTILITNSISAQFVHPGISHKLSDLDRMKAMVEAGIEPYATSFQNLSSNSRAQSDYSVNVASSAPTALMEYPGPNRNWFLNDGTAAYYNALMWYITEDVAHANKAIEILNTYKGITKVTEIPLTAGRVWRIIEAAEIIAHTYHENDYANGWSATDIQDFKDMLIYPGYSTTTIPTGDATFYWKIYNGDVFRHGNQGLFAFRTMMAIAIFTDNQTMYDRVMYYLKGLDLPAGDLPFPTGPVIQGTEITSCDYFDEYSGNTFGTTPNYHGNEAIENYIYENGQGQESSRDQAHAVAGISTIAVISEMAWNQGDDLYGFLDNRPLLGLEFFYKYNMSYTVQNEYPDQLTPWEPTVDSGEYIVRTDRSGRWTSQKINPFVNCDETNLTRGGQNLEPIYEMNLGHYRDRMNLPSDDYKWLERGHAYLTTQIGVEGEGTVTDHPGYGGLKFRRVTPGDPIRGFDVNGLPVYKMNELPMIIEAENYDYFVLDGQDKTYNDITSSNTDGEYRTDEGVDVKVCSESGFAVTGIQDGEWLTYTVNVPSDGLYDIDINYASVNASGKIKFNFGGVDITSDVTVPFGASDSSGLTDWKDLKVGNSVRLTKGVQAMKIMFSGTDHAFELNNINISLIQEDLEATNLALDGVATQSSTDYDGPASLAIDGNTNGNYGGGSVSHTSNSDSNSWWQVELQSESTIESINIFNRTGGNYGLRLSNFRVTVYNEAGVSTFTNEYTTAPSPSLTIDTGNVLGKIVKIELLTGSGGMNLAEVEVYGVNKTLSLSETEVLNKVLVFPNPVLDKLSISLENPNFDLANITIVLYTINGQEVMKMKLNNKQVQLDLSELNRGVYFLKINDTSKSITKKIIKI